MYLLGFGGCCVCRIHCCGADVNSKDADVYGSSPWKNKTIPCSYFSRCFLDVLLARLNYFALLNQPYDAMRVSLEELCCKSF